MKQKILHIRTVLLQVDELLKEYTYLLCKRVNFSIIGAILHNLCLLKFLLKINYFYNSFFDSDKREREREFGVLPTVISLLAYLHVTGVNERRSFSAD